MERNLSMKWVPSAGETKLGGLMASVVGSTRDETWRSCAGCDLREVVCPECHGTGKRRWRRRLKPKTTTCKRCRGGGTVLGPCYSWTGRSGNMEPRGHSFETAWELSGRGDPALRVATKGDPARANRAELMRAVGVARAHGMGVLCFTHFALWEPRTGWLRHHSLASANNLFEGTVLKRRGWKVAVILDYVPTRARIVSHGLVLGWCPAQRRPDKWDCRRCAQVTGGGLCDVPTLRRIGLDGVGFVDHSPAARRLLTLAPTGKSVAL